MNNKPFLITVAVLIIAMSSLAQVKPKAVLKPQVKGTGTSKSQAKQTTGTFTDSRDGKVYKTVTIGTQTWMAENLAFKVQYGCWADNNDSIGIATYGYLYDWETAKTVCPAGWHLPTDAEWTILTSFLGGIGVAGGKLKETGSSHWKIPNSGATNKSGFTALPTNYRDYDGTFNRYRPGTSSYWWSSTENSISTAWFCSVSNDYINISRNPIQRACGLSVRCLKN